MSQLVAMEVWPERLTIAALGALALICATINARMLLISASLQPWLGAMPPWQIYPALHLTVDPGWLIAMRYRAEGGSDIGVFFGSGAMLAFTWMSATSAGYFAGALVSDPAHYRPGDAGGFAAMLVRSGAVRGAPPPGHRGGRADRSATPGRLVVHHRGRDRGSVGGSFLDGD
jgi:hypothetical protein